MPSGEGRSIPPGFWGLPEVRAALSRRSLGDVLKLVKDDFGWSQYALADMTGLTQPQVSNYIHHKSVPTMDIIARAAGGLGMPAHVRQQFGLARAAAAGHSQADAPRVRLSQITALAERIGQTGDTSGLCAWRDAALATTGPEDAWARLFEVLSVEAPEELRGPARIKARTRGFFLAAAKLPARLVIEALTSHVNETGLLLATVPDTGLRRELTLASGEASYLVACCDIDLGDPGSALNGLKVTGEAARAADDAALAAITLDGHSHFHAFTGNHRQMLALVQQGLEKAAVSDSPGTLAHMQLRLAEAHLDLGHTAEAVKAWEQAEASFARTDLTTDRDWTRLWITPDCFESVRAYIYASTGRTDDAVPIARNLVSRLSGALGKTDAVALANVALALALAGEFSLAAGAGRQALGAIREAEVRGCMPRAHVLAQMIRDRGKLTSPHKAFINDVEDTQRQLDALN